MDAPNQNPVMIPAAQEFHLSFRVSDLAESTRLIKNDLTNLASVF